VPDTINGLPLHPLVVHAVVVLLPLASLGVIALAVRPSWRARYGILVIAVAALGTAAIPVATDSGESLEARVGDPGRHAELGDSLIWFAIPLLLAAVGLFWLDRRAARGITQVTPGDDDSAERYEAAARPTASRTGTLALVASALAVLVAGANLVQVYRIGDSGARAAWGRTATEARPSGHR
jgi:uncharacterized membrane protein